MAKAPKEPTQHIRLTLKKRPGIHSKKNPPAKMYRGQGGRA